MRTRSSFLEAHRSSFPGLLTGCAALVAVVALSGDNGGYFPTAWGWAAIGFSWLAAVALLVRRSPAIARSGLIMLSAVVLLAVWEAVSIAWSGTATRSMSEVERTLVYVAALLALFAGVSRSAVAGLLRGLLGGIFVIVSYSLATMLFPERLGMAHGLAGTRLSEPLGYPNALGIFAALGALLALGVAARDRSAVARGLAGAAFVILSVALYFSFSRGAAGAFAVGVVAFAALGPGVLRRMTAGSLVGCWAALGVLVASRSDALTTRDAPLGAAAREGHRLAAIVAALAVASAVSMIVFGAVADRVRVAEHLRTAYAGALSLATLLTAVLIFTVYAPPWTLAARAYGSFSPAQTSSADLNRHFLTLSGNRKFYWEVAWHNFLDHPWAGSGAGTYERVWLRERSVRENVKDAHGLYVEVLSELGPLGLLLVLSSFAVPLARAVRARNHPVAPAATGAYVAFLIHVGVDWDWEMPAVTTVGLVCGAALVIAAHRDQRVVRIASWPRRTAAGGFAMLVAALALVGLTGNRSASVAADAVQREGFGTAVDHADTARRWAPWSSEPLRLLGEARLLRGDLPGARKKFEQALAKDNEDWSLWIDLALASEGNARRRAAARALELNPFSTNARRLLKTPRPGPPGEAQT